VINAHSPDLVSRQRGVAPVWRATPRLFWTLFAIVGLFVAASLIYIGSLLLPPQAPLANAGDYQIIREAIWSRVDGSIDDPLIEVAPGMTARASSVRGFALEGQTYYYYFEGRSGFDPLSRGIIDRSEIEIVLRDAGGPAPLVIYRIVSKNRASG